MSTRISRIPAAPPQVEPLRAEPITDAELVRRALEGDRWAEGAIYRRYAPLVANLAGRLLARHADAMDVLQDVFVGALGELGALRDPNALRPWLLRRTVRQVHRVFRRRRLRRVLGLDRGEIDLPLDALADPSASPETHAELARIARVLATLSDRQRIAWVLHRVEGETLPAVADACGVSLATVKREIAAAQLTLEAHARRSR
ncbi:MAG: RNA polymerase sigma factor [Sandaracinaceae bacterium]|nr:RNA polymerase sigma factor [Sandaracinaceae bacterium]